MRGNRSVSSNEKSLSTAEVTKTPYLMVNLAFLDLRFPGYIFATYLLTGSFGDGHFAPFLQMTRGSTAALKVDISPNYVFEFKISCRGENFHIGDCFLILLCELVVFENYSEPADLLRNELSTFGHEDESDPVYMAPVDDATQASNWAANEEEDMYCVPYEGSDAPPPLPSPCLGPGL
ncbi:hypothetical protein AVEN_113331-1 [Araneus ventricosus]|uniref:Uncharacterized protein n=1 Tax=Araneus ventricosus TaxID=182803 RepID=A0A4Y2HAH5_ARAVE|nr:hypothetical protein AVEN_113331-1 [Araneus ventricosus]